MSNPSKIGRYEIIERVGRGGMGVLYRGRDTVLEREVAIKVMSTDFDADSDDTARPRFYREARAAAKLQHRNIVTIFEFGEEEHTPFIVMEFLRGQDLAKRMKAEPPLALEEKLDIVADLCTGLHFAHEQGVVHRDVKPGNIWIQPDGSVKLLDFGIAKFASSTMTRQGAVFGSVSYMAPEQISGGEVDGRADIFSAGVVLYELLTGKKPFHGDSPTAVLARIMDDRPAPLEELGPEVPRPLAAAVAKALQKDREKRYRHAADFGADLRLVRSALAASETFTTDVELGHVTPAVSNSATIVLDTLRGEPAGSISLVAGPTPATVMRGPSRVKWVAAAVAGALLVVVGGALLLTNSLRTAPRQPEPAKPPTSTSQPGAAQPTPGTPSGQKAAAGADSERPRGRGPAGPSGRGGAPSTTPQRSGDQPGSAVPTGPATSPATRADPDPVSRPVRTEFGRLQLRAQDTCTVSIDDRDFGEPPYPPEIPLAAGNHVAKLTCDGALVRRVEFRVVAGELKPLHLVK